MKNSQFDAKTFGVGQLITQRKLFRVPAHQRSYAWETEAVKAFLGDIEEAYSERDSDYFIGLVVLLGPENSEWVLLDGQQRLTTASLIFSAIRQWLTDHGHREDASQVDHEYIGVRRLGGEYSSRMQLNAENQAAFRAAVIEQKTTLELRHIVTGLPRKSSNRLLLSAAIACREWVEEIATSKSAPERALFDLVAFLDARVKVVCVDVSSEVDAYVLFESLNDRGIELSALDLIKNHIIGRDDSLESSWPELIEAIGDANPDDFLKVFWTSRFGITPKAQIFRRVKDVYADSSAVRSLMSDLIEDANMLAALDDADHPFWHGTSAAARDEVFLIRQLGTKQARPVVIAALRNLSGGVLQEFLWQLIVGVVRFQVIGRGRTGVIEKIFGRLCQALSRGDIHTAADSRELLADLFIPDEAFEAAFKAHVDVRYARVAYLLAEIASQHAAPQASRADRARVVRQLIQECDLETLLRPGQSCVPPSAPELRRVGNYALSRAGQLLGGSGANAVHDIDDVEARSEQLAVAACAVWAA